MSKYRNVLLYNWNCTWHQRQHVSRIVMGLTYRGLSFTNVLKEISTSILLSLKLWNNSDWVTYVICLTWVLYSPFDIWWCMTFISFRETQELKCQNACTLGHTLFRSLSQLECLQILSQHASSSSSSNWNPNFSALS
jgi:hypothetical protein